MKIRCCWEHNGDDTLLYALDYVGAYARGENLAAASAKMPEEIASYLAWIGQDAPEDVTVEVAQERVSTLTIADADSDVLLDGEEAPLSREEYARLKALALRSAQDFLTLYSSIPDKDASCLPVRNTFYGPVPRTAGQMYEHTKNVNRYYFGEIGVDADNDGTILACRQRGFALLEQSADFLSLPPIEGSYGEMWSLRKVLRRFVWHDRIHARAMYRMALRTFGACENPFRFIK